MNSTQATIISPPRFLVVDRSAANLWEEDDILLMFSHLFVLNSRGDTLVFRDYRGDITQKCTEIFYDKVKNGKDIQPPCFNIDGINYIFIRSAGLYFVVTTKRNISPTCALEFLQRFTVICKDYCGVLNENTIQQNFVLIYEILNEVLNFGLIQETSSKNLTPSIQNEPVVVEPYNKPKQFPGGAVFGFDKLSIGSESANRPLGHCNRFNSPEKGEIFSEILEQLIVLIDSEGNVVRSEVIGSIKLRSFLPEGFVLIVHLSDELHQLHSSNDLGTELDDYNCHPSVDCNGFESTGKLSVMPSPGEFTIMNYRMSGKIPKGRLPFLVGVTTTQEPTASKTLDVSITINCNIPHDKYAGKLTIQFPVPKNTESVSCSGQAVEFIKHQNLVVWKLAKIHGGTVIEVVFKLSGSFEDSPPYKVKMDSLSIRFEIPSFICSGGRVKSFRVCGGDGKLNQSRKWTRMITYSDSYVVRL